MSIEMMCCYGGATSLLTLCDPCPVVVAIHTSRGQVAQPHSSSSSGSSSGR